MTAETAWAEARRAWDLPDTEVARLAFCAGARVVIDKSQGVPETERQAALHALNNTLQVFIARAYLGRRKVR